MKLTLFIAICVFVSTVGMAQNKYGSKTGTINFEASVPSFEEVKAVNENVSAILNADNGEFVSLALVKGFRFKVALMEEHFNENYIESSKFPKAIFKGKLQDFDFSEVSETNSEYILKGTITIHGVTEPFETSVKIKKVNEKIELQTEFGLNPDKFNIKIPKIVSNKIANEVFVKAIYSLSN